MTGTVPYLNMEQRDTAADIFAVLHGLPVFRPESYEWQVEHEDGVSVSSPFFLMYFSFSVLRHAY